MLSTHEHEMMKDIERRLSAMRAQLSKDIPPLENSAGWYAYLAGLKEIQGNASNDVSFVATLLAKQFLADRYGVTKFDAAEKPQGAPGIDIDVRLANGKRLVGEIKTTSPYKPNDLGAQQRTMFEKDFFKLSEANADIKLFLVTEQRTYDLMKKPIYLSMLHGVSVVLINDR